MTTKRIHNIRMTKRLLRYKEEFKGNLTRYNLKRKDWKTIQQKNKKWKK